MQVSALDDAAWASPWRLRRVGEKVTLSLGLVLTALLAPPWPGVPLVALASILAILGAARIHWRVLMAAMAAPVTFLLIGSVAVLVNVGGCVPGGLCWGPLSIGPGSLIRALELFGHGLAGTLAVMVLATSTPMVDLLTWLRRLRIPDACLEVASLMYRLLFILLATAYAVHDAQRNRLGDAPAGPGATRRRFDNAASGMGVVLVRAWDRARRMEDGLAGRGYDSALVTLPRIAPVSWGFRLGVLGTLAAVWALIVVLVR